ncbi:MAG: hypothetical protein WBG10_08030 [Pseudolabrys sp.]
MPALLPVLLTASQVVLAADTIPKFNVELTCRAAAEASTNPGRGSGDCQRDETDAQGKLQQEWAQYTSTQRADCVRFAGLDRAPSYVELLTCLEMAKQVQELPEQSKVGTSGSKVGTTGSKMGTSGRQ